MSDPIVELIAADVEATVNTIRNPRLCAIVAVTTGAAGHGAFKVGGDLTQDLAALGSAITVAGSTANDGAYTLAAGSTYDVATGRTTVNVAEAVGNATADGTASITTIWNQDLTAVRPTRFGFEGNAAPENGKVVIFQTGDSDDAENSTDGGIAAKARNQPFALAAFVIPSDTDTTPIDTRMNRVRADLEKKLLQDMGRSGYAIDTMLTPAERYADGVVVHIEVSYRTRLFDPYVRA